MNAKPKRLPRIDPAAVEAAVLAAAERLAPAGGPIPLGPLARVSGYCRDQTRAARDRLKRRGLWRWEVALPGRASFLWDDPQRDGPDWPPPEELARRIREVRAGHAPPQPPPPSRPDDLRRRVRGYRLEWRRITGRAS